MMVLGIMGYGLWASLLLCAPAIEDCDHPQYRNTEYHLRKVLKIHHLPRWLGSDTPQGTQYISSSLEQWSDLLE